MTQEKLIDLTERLERIGMGTAAEPVPLYAVEMMSVIRRYRAIVEQMAGALASCNTLHNSCDYYQSFDEQLVHDAFAAYEAEMEKGRAA